MFNEQDLRQISEHGLTVEKVEKQIADFVSGFPSLNVKSAASVGDGIVKMCDAETFKYREIYASASKTAKVAKFVPASGAATRMFKDLFAYLSDGVENAVVEKTLANKEKFAFAEVLNGSLKEGADGRAVISGIIDGELGYGSKPKGMILFHSYPDGARTAFEEHLCEGAAYASCNGEVKIHFTVSPEHIDGFKALADEAVARCSKKYGVKYDISFSVQKSSTDTIAVDNDNKPFRNDDGTLLFRPAGHGALIENLNEIDADLIFIKNIDNVTTDALREETILYKKVLAGVLLEAMGQARCHLLKMDNGEADLHEVMSFVENKLCVQLPANWSVLPEKELAERLRGVLNRPFRVCGMVKNEGEPGGGPFWAYNTDGTVSLQIAESSQIGAEDKELMKASTHFNPVDLVCGVKNYKGEKFDLREYVDPETGFISSKSKSGRELKALELPGLWNGAMSKWNTLFVEVPVSTFTPVKVVTDLLRPQHQPTE